MDNPLAPPEAELHSLHLPETALSRTIDRFVCWVGEFASLLWTALMLSLIHI